ncbi:MAG: proline racemase [Candidatus Marinimicrobia bacterium]|nr:proline racemase [Candidatus Neomarinimicrobiota bacterium]|tara:strand:- start:476 stop:1525 length:1050 start_codon:yes stop_codon:yes gene_type:complete
MELADISKLRDWEVPEQYLKISTVDVHTGGEPLRIIVDGFPSIKGSTVLEKRSYVREHYDHLRTSLMWEPRGHSDMYGAIIVEPNSSAADFGVIFLHNEGYSTGCGHAVLGLTKTFVETGLIKSTGETTDVVMDVPSGMIHAEAISENGKVIGARFRNVLSFVQCLDGEVDVVDYGTVRYDIAFGGAFYAFVNVSEIGMDALPGQSSSLISAGMAIRKALAEAVAMDHPNEPEMNHLYGTIFVADSDQPEVHSRHVCIFADGQIDRCPTGTGVSARLAILHERGMAKMNQAITIDSILGTSFSGCVVEIQTLNGREAVIPEVTGTSHITGRQTFVIDSDDPLKDGFLLR